MDMLVNLRSLKAKLAEKEGEMNLSLGSLSAIWNLENGDTDKKDPHKRLAQRVSAAFPNISNGDRYAILSYIFQRPITSSYDLKKCEAKALEANAFPPTGPDQWHVYEEFVHFLSEVKGVSVEQI